MLLTRDQILTADDLVTETVEVPEWGGSVLVRGMSGTQRDKFEADIVNARGQKDVRLNMANIRARLVAASLVDENGDLLFDIKDITALGKKSAVALQRVFDKAKILSGIVEDDVQELADKLEENSFEGSVSD